MNLVTVDSSSRVLNAACAACMLDTGYKTFTLFDNESASHLIEQAERVDTYWCKEIEFSLSLNIPEQCSLQMIPNKNSLEDEGHNHDSSFDYVYNQASIIANYFKDSFNYFDSKSFGFPAAAAEISTTIPHPCSNDLLSDECYNSMPPDYVGQILETVNIELEELAGKNCIRLLGYSGSGRSTFINYLFSDKCTMDPSEVRCSLTMSQSGGGNSAITKHIQGYFAGNLVGFAPDTSIVDFPGFLGKSDNQLMNFIESIVALDSIEQVGKVANTVVDVVLIDFDSLEAGRGEIGDLVRTLKLDHPIPNRIIVVSKVPVSVDKKVGRDPAVRRVSPNKESIKKVLLENGIHITLANNLLLYDLEDKDIALNSDITSGGGSNKIGIISSIAALQSQEIVQKNGRSIESNSSIPLEFLSTRVVRENFNKIEKLLQEALKAPAMNQGTFNTILDLERTKFIPLIKRIEDVVRGLNVNEVQQDSITKFRKMLDDGSIETFKTHFFETLMPLANNPITKSTFEKVDVVSFYVNSVLLSKVLNEDIKNSTILKEINDNFSNFTSRLTKSIFDKLNAIESSIRKDLSTCGFYRDEESEKWKKYSEILGLNLSNKIKEIEVLSKKLKLVQEKFPGEQKKQIENQLKAIRTLSVVMLLGSWLLSRYFSSLKTKKLLLTNQKILVGKVAGLPFYFLQGAKEVKHKKTYNIWQKSGNGDNLKLVGEFKLGAQLNVLITENQKYHLLESVDLISGIRHLETVIDEKIDSMHRTEVRSIFVNYAVAFLNLSISSQLMVGMGSLMGLGYIDSYSVGLLKSLRIDELIQYYWGDEIHSQACEAVIKNLGLHA